MCACNVSHSHSGSGVVQHGLWWHAMAFFDTVAGVSRCLVETVAAVQENHAHAPVVCQREGTVEKHSRIWGNEQSLECLKPHRSKLEQEQAQWRRAAQQQQQQQ